MKKIISALLAVSAFAVAAPAMAQDHGGYGRGDHRDDRGVAVGERYGDNLRAGYDQIERKIDMGARRGALTRREASMLSSQLRDLRRLDRQYRYSDGRLSRWERTDLENRSNRLEARLRFERRDDDRRGGGYRH